MIWILEIYELGHRDLRRLIGFKTYNEVIAYVNKEGYDLKRKDDYCFYDGETNTIYNINTIVIM